jgi:nitrate reductase delta subunit
MFVPNFALNSPPPMANTLRVLSALLDYPDALMRGYLPEMSELLRDEGALSPARRADVEALMDTLRQADPLQAESDYVELFDRGRATSLHLFEHVHGDSRERGPALIDLGQTYENAGLILAEGELPDFMPALLEFVSTQPPGEARAFLGEMAHILNAIFGALQQRGSAYASVLGALLDLAGEQATALKPFAPLAEEPLDASWAEPVVFDGCSAKGQARPGQAQAIHVIPFQPVRAPGAQANPQSGVVA